MLNASNLSIVFDGKQKLFEDVNLSFKPGNCYGIIGANGSGKSTLLRILSGQLDSTTGSVSYDKKLRLSFLEQDQHKYDEVPILNVVLSGFEKLYSIIEERSILYAKEEFTEKDGFRSAELEEKFAELNGWEAEAEAEIILNGLNLETKDYSSPMKNLSGPNKVKVLLAKALFGKPDILLLDEPTNHLDFQTIKWLEQFLISFNSTVIVVSHDRHFLNTVCTHIVDIDYGEAKLYTGNYDFWKQSSELMRTLTLEQNKKKEQQIKELEAFIARFSANASKSKQATSRKKTLDKINLDEIRPSSRKYPYIKYEPKQRLGEQVIEIENLSCTHEGLSIKDLSLNMTTNDKLAIICEDDNLIHLFFEIIAGNIQNYDGEVTWGSTVDFEYLPKDISEFFNENNLTLIQWLSSFSENKEDGYIRSFLGKMLFSKEEPLKKVKVLSGGEKMRMMFSRIMLLGSNVLLLNQPTNHLDLETISSLGDSLVNFEGAIIYASHDLSLIEEVANKILYLSPNGSIVYEGTYEEFSNSESIQEKVKELDPS